MCDYWINNILKLRGHSSHVFSGGISFEKAILEVKQGIFV